MPQYYPLWPPRRFGKLMWAKWIGPSKHRPPCLQDSLRHAPDKPITWAQWLLILVSIPSCYYLFNYFIGYNTAVVVGPLHLAAGTTTEAETLEESLEVTPAHVVTTTSTVIPLPTINVEDLIPHGKIKKGFQPLVKSPYMAGYHSYGADIFKKFVEKRTVMTEKTTATQDPMKGAMTCVSNNHKGNYEVVLNKTVLSLEWVDSLYPEVGLGGHYKPSCQTRHQVAILVPYTWHRRSNLATFLFNMHPFLMQQNLEYRIFVLEQKVVTPQTPFNKGRLYNGGFLEARKVAPWRCVVFHDVDLLPLDRRILYTCPSQPRHMCGAVREKKKDKSYRSYFGGVTVMTPEQYVKANGYSNMFWAWGGEDHDMFWRIKNAGYAVVRYNISIAEYTMLPHIQTPVNNIRYNLLKTTVDRQNLEGLSTVDYKVMGHKNYHLYTHIEIDVNPYKEDVTA